MTARGAAGVAAALHMQPHPEGGWYVETWRAAATVDEGGALRGGERPASAAAARTGAPSGERPAGGEGPAGERPALAGGERPAGSAILYLLAAGERSHWHRVDADEIWSWSGGDALELRVWADGDSAVTDHRLGPDVASGCTAQATVPAGAWQAARTLGAWTLVGCIVIPAFEFAGFELAPPDWQPPTAPAGHDGPAAPGRR